MTVAFPAIKSTKRGKTSLTSPASLPNLYADRAGKESAKAEAMRRLRGGHTVQDNLHRHSLAQFYQTPFDVAYEQLSKQRALRRLEQLFYECDEDGSGGMSLDELQQSLKQPAIMKTFAQLGVQPHQSEVIFRSMDKSKSGELTINAFIGGLTEMVDFEAGKELDIDMLRAGNQKTKKKQVWANFSPQQEAPRQPSTRQLHRAFMNSASAQALHPATATWRGDRTSCSL